MKNNPDDRPLSFAELVPQLPVGITVLRGRNFTVEMANDTYLQIVDRDHDQFVGRSLYDSLPEVKEAVDGLLNGVMDTGEPYEGFEFPVTLKRFGQEELTYFNFVYQPLRDKTDKVTGVVVIANEVTSLVRTKHRLEENEHRLGNILRNSPFGMVILRGNDMIIELANNTVLGLWRRQLNEVLGKSILEVFPELNEQKFPELMRQVLETRISHKEYEAVAYIDSFDGRKTFYLDFEYAPLLDKEGSSSGIMISVHNVTERVESRKKIQQTEQSLRLAIEAADMGTFDWNMKTNFFLSSPRLKEIFGFSPGDDIPHQKLIDALYAEDKPTRDRAVELSKKTGILSYEARVLWADGSRHWVRVHGKIQWQESVPERMYGTVIDITDQKMSLQALQQSEAKLKELSGSLEEQVQERTRELTELNVALAKSNAELAEFAYVSSHDLQEPARKIQTFISRIEGIEGERMSSQMKDYFNRISSSAARMQRLINDLLSYSRATASEVKFERIDLNLILENVKEHYTEKILQSEATLIADDLPEMKVIPFQIEQLFINLIGNALKYSRPGVPPVIEITSQLADGKSLHLPKTNGKLCRITIQDNGIGFDPQFSERIFQLFQRLHERDEYEGTGIGLSICKKIIENHGGHIEASSAPGLGSRFVIHLPMT